MEASRGFECNSGTSAAHKIENYEILSELGRGGMSTVYLARDILLDRTVALKVLNPGLKNTENYLKRIRDEARILSTIEHPGIVKTHAFGISRDGQVYLVMEHLHGNTLASLLDRKKTLDKDEFLKIFIPVLDALAHAHKNDIVHRDIKPANIMLLDAGGPCLTPEVKLLDFGISKNLADISKNQQLTTGLLGTPQFMSPEQCQGEPCDARSDVYSLACVMYQALSGKAPFAAESALQIMYKRMTESIPTISKSVGKRGFSPALLKVILKALSRDPAQRPQNAAEFRRQVQQAIAQPQSQLRRLSLAAGGTAFLLACLSMLTFMPKNADASLSNHKLEKSIHNNHSISYSSDLREADDTLKSGDRQSAIRKYRQVLQRARSSDSDDSLEKSFQAHRGLALCFEQLGDLKKANSEYESAASVYDMTLSDKRLRIICEQALFLFNHKKNSEAMELLNTTIHQAELALEGAGNRRLGDLYAARAKVELSDKNKRLALSDAKRSLWHYDHTAYKRSWAGATESLRFILSMYDSDGQKQAADDLISETKPLIRADKFEASRVMYDFAGELEKMKRFQDARYFYSEALKYSKFRIDPTTRKEIEKVCKDSLQRLSK